MASEKKPLSFVVFGATGGTGVEICKQAVAQGHHVTAYVRSPEKLKLESPLLEKVKGDLADVAALEGAVRGKDAVLVALGGYGLIARDTTCSVGTKAIMEAMKKEGTKRLVVCSSYGCGSPENRKLLPWFVQLMLTQPLADKDVQEAEILKSDLDYTIVRPPRLLDGEAKGDLVEQEEGKLPVNSISRADVAAFMIRVAAENSWVKKIAHISWKAGGHGGK